MMLPARACWLPKSFTPRRLLSLSRPLRLEPPAFLCAMTYCYLNFVKVELLGLRGLLGCGLSRCSILCRRRLVGLCLRLSLLGRSFGRRSHFRLRRCSSGLGLGRSGLSLGLRTLGRGLLVADRHDLQNRVLL